MPAIHDIVLVPSLNCACCGGSTPGSISKKDGILTCNDDCYDRCNEIHQFGKEMEASQWEHDGQVIATVVKPVAFTLHRRTKAEKEERDQRRVLEESRRREDATRKLEEARRKTEAARRKTESERMKQEQGVQFNVQNVLKQLDVSMPVLDYKALKQIGKDEDLTELQSCIISTAVSYLRQFEQ